MSDINTYDTELAALRNGYLDGIVMKRTWAGEVRNVSVLVAIAVNVEGYHEILGIVEGLVGLSEAPEAARLEGIA